ncbi:MAG TPA: 2-dehydropantoate 2-reductase, partial [Acidimicrobiales bacterium]|nr:2-dehydropantoate 2-reductase [Acidimicrobiales bacterium]
GAGAIGGVVGARLFQAGHDVVLIARGDHLDAIQSQGLRLETPDETLTVEVPAVGSAAQAGLRAGDVVLLAVKSQDTAAALATLPIAVPVVCLQNGVENERVALRLFPDVYGCCVLCPASHLEPGSVVAYSSPVTGALDVGRYPGGVDETAVAVATAFRASTFESVARPDVMRWKYAKLLTNLGNAVEAVLGPDARGGAIAQRVREEGVACLRAAGVDFASEEEDAERRASVAIRPVAGQRRGGGSSWQSLARGSGSIEADYLNGEIALLGRMHGVPTPVNATVQRLANRVAAERRPPGSITEAALLEALGQAAQVD